MTTYSSDSTEWCPQHGYPLPCPKCGMGEYEHGLQDKTEFGIKCYNKGIIDGMKVVEGWIHQNGISCMSNTPSNQDEYIGFHKPSWQAKLKEWGI